MKPKPTQLLKFTACVLFAAILQSCGGKTGSWKNEQIDASTRDELHKLNEQTFNYIKAGDANLESMLSKELLEDKTTKTLAQRANHELMVDSFARFNEYYVVNKTTEALDLKVDDGINSHHLVYAAPTKETYIVLLSPQNKAVANKTMITAVYSHYDYGWKLSKIDLGTYAINGKTAPELYDFAKAEYGKGNLMSAANIMSMATNCARPNAIWQYRDEAGLFKFSGKTNSEADAKYLFPFPITKISSEPLILGVTSSITDEGTFPVIRYQSKISLNNKDAIKKEKDQIKKAIGVLMPGIDKNKYLIFSAYNELPSATTSVNHVDMREQLP